MAKSATFGVMHIGIAFGVSYSLTGSWTIAGAITFGGVAGPVGGVGAPGGPGVVVVVVGGPSGAGGGPGTGPGGAGAGSNGNGTPPGPVLNGTAPGPANAFNASPTTWLIANPNTSHDIMHRSLRD